MQYSKAIYSVKQTRQIEEYLITKCQIPEFELMFQAGKAVFNILQSELSDIEKQYPIFILCGSGNNGGDGYIAAALANAAGFQVTCLEIGDFSKQTNTAKKAKKFAEEKQTYIKEYNDDNFPEKSIIIDAILGIGIKGVVREEQAKIITKINHSQAFIIAIDNPSGLDCDSGEILGIAVKAHLTITFLARKQGLYLNYGNSHSGKIIFSNLNAKYDDFLHNLSPQYHILEENDLSKIIPPRELNSHKGNFGNIVIIGGDYNMGGAVIMAAEAACRSGAGKVTILTQKEHISAIISRLPNVMTASFESKEYLEQIKQNKTLIAIGPGLGQSDWSKTLFDFFMASDVPKIIDADALNLLSKSTKKYNLQNAIITPHPKEAARLLEISVEEVQNNRQKTVQDLFNKYGAIIILKGSNSLIYNGDGNFYVCPYGNPAMAVAGMGDILTGFITGFATQNITLTEATILGVYYHALKADKICKTQGEIGLLPMDMF